MKSQEIFKAGFQKLIMQLHIESPHFEPNEGFTDLIRNKFDHLSKRYDRINRCEVVMRKEKSDKQKEFFIEAKLDVPRRTLFASDRAEIFEVALDKVIHDLEHQLTRHKEELEDAR